MEAFTRLFQLLDETNRSSEKQAHLTSYFRSTPPEDAAWAVVLLSGHRFRRPVSTSTLREWTSALSGLPEWLVEECYERVGDLAETLALLYPEGAPSSQVSLPLHQLIEDRILPLKELPETARRERITRTWAELGPRARFVFNKLLTGGFRVGVQRQTVIRALAEAFDQETTAIAQALAGNWQPSAEAFLRLRHAEEEESRGTRPYAFALAHALDDDSKCASATTLGSVDDWFFEWKWDGIRGQLIRQPGEIALWSRGDEALNETFPEILEMAQALPPGTALDGEVIAWREGRPLPFADLQRRIGRKKVGRKLLSEVPCTFLAFDLLREDHQSCLALPQAERRLRLEHLLSHHPFPVSPMVPIASWKEVPSHLAEARERGVEGLMLKNRKAAYPTGRVRGVWWKWKVDPLSVDAVLIYAQAGHGRRAGLFTDYTFAVRDGDSLVPFAKAYSGLDEAEIRRLDRWIRANTLERFGPVRSVPAEHVFEIGFEGIRPSTRHRSGIAVRFPRILRWREDLKPADADSLKTLNELLPTQ